MSVEARSACGSQYAPSSVPPPRCVICEDERQYVPPRGQTWTTLATVGSCFAVPRSEFSPDQQMVDRDRAAALHQEIEGGHGPHQREFEAHLVPEKSAHSPALVVRHDEETDDREGSE